MAAVYDLLAEPFEENDLAAKHLKVVARMASGFARWARSAESDAQKVIEKYYQDRARPAKVKTKISP